VDYKSLYYPESNFGGFTDVDGTIAFYLRVNSLISRSASVILDIGCGRGAYAEDPVRLRKDLRVLQGKGEKIIGIDVSETAEDNPFIDEFYLIEESGHWPLEDESVDICLCDNVLEHVEDPELFFFECQRVTKREGYLCIRTTNVLSYVGLFSKLIPSQFHVLVLSKVQNERKEEDVYPTLYKCNTVKKIRDMLNRYNFVGCAYGYEPEPDYLSFSRLFYRLGVLHQRFAPQGIKPVIFAFGKKEN
jgi:SAM-dependent methyltransferase